MNRGISQKRFDEMPQVIPSPGDTALIIIDMQYVDAHPDYGLAKKAKEEGKESYTSRLLEAKRRALKKGDEE